jgi:hypothetical protein
MMLNAESVRGEGRCHYVDCLTAEERSALEALDIETAFFGSRARQRAERAMKLIAAEVERRRG